MELNAVNDFVIRFANVNGSGSASANNLFSKSVFKMGVPVSPKNIFPSNIQGLPTWYEVRVSEKGYLGRRSGIDIIVAVNPQSIDKDILSIKEGGYLIYDSSKKLHPSQIRPDINYIGIPMINICMEHFPIPRQQQLFKNILYVGALCALIDLDIQVVKDLVSDQFKKKPKLIPANHQALDLGYNYVVENLQYPLGIRLEARTGLIGDKILVEGNDACALGAIYGGATVLSWYPITPSTSVAAAFESYCKKLRVDPSTGKNNFAVVQAEDELAAIGMVIGATWNGARSFTATSGPGVSLMSEFIGLAYFAEIPVVLVNVQRGGPSTGMPTRTQQPDLLSSAYASHGDTKHVLLFPSNPKECFEFSAMSFDLADQLQTPVILMSDLDLGMNFHLSDPFEWDDNRKYKQGKVLSADDLDQMEVFGRYLDVDDDGICYRTIPGTHPTKGSFFTRGTSRDEYAKYTEDGDVYVKVVDRLIKKWESAKSYVPTPEIFNHPEKCNAGMVYFGTTSYAAKEAMDLLEAQGKYLNTMRIKAFPFNDQVKNFIDAHETIFVVEQNRDAQFKSMLVNELSIDPNKIISVLNYDGKPITAQRICDKILNAGVFPELAEVNV